jgi:succinate-semialdehyde dehydrogenase/glutarate-semialdehyde dehydrogenase
MSDLDVLRGVKASGLVREGGFEGIEEYLETTSVAIPAP